jgi:DNA repair exonuclease SbcCD ATPase subunit
MRRKQQELRYALHAAQSQRQEISHAFVDAEKRLATVMHFRDGLREIGDLLSELNTEESTMHSLESAVDAYHQARSRTERLRGEISAWKDFKAELDSVETLLRSLRQREEEIERLIHLLEELVNEELEGL